MYKRIYQKKLLLKIISFLPFLLLAPILFVSITEIGGRFKYDLDNGYGYKEKVYMRQQLNPYMSKLSVSEPTLFYFDIHSDYSNSFFYGNTITSGFKDWIMWLPSINFKKERTLQYISNMETLKLSIFERNGVKGIFYDNVFYKLDNFYAIRFNNKNAFDITQQIKKKLEFID